MDPSSYNGGSVLVMKGKEAFAMASDLRFGMQYQTFSTNFEKICRLEDNLFLGAAGLATDVLRVHEITQSQVDHYHIYEDKSVRPKVLMNMLSDILYSHRFAPYYIEPVVGGFDSVTGKPIIGSTDCIGCQMFVDDFCAVGTSIQQLLGVCEVLWKPDMSNEQLFETISQAFMSASDRDAFTGWGVVVYLVEKDKCQRFVLNSRMD